MLPLAASSSDTLRGFLGVLSPDQSSCSSTTGDVLTRSTRVLHESGPGPVQITVQRVRDRQVHPPSAGQQSSGTESEQRPKLRQKPDSGPAPRAAANCQPDKRMLKKPEMTKELRRRVSPNRKSSTGTLRDGETGDLLTSRFFAGGRGVMLTALRQRSHSAPRRREVRVQLLDPGPLQTVSQHAPGTRTCSPHAVGVAEVQREAELSSGCPGDETNAAHFIKNSLEAQVSQLTDDVQKLLQVHREGVDSGWSLSQQTLCHLERLHSHQLQLEGQLLESALRLVVGCATVIPTTSDPGHLRVTHLETADTFSNQQPITTATTETSLVTTATSCLDQWTEQTRDDPHCPCAPSVSTATQPGNHLQSLVNHSQAAERRANEMLREMRHLKTEMKMLLKPEDSLKTTRPPQDPHQEKLLQPQQSQPQQSQSQQSQPQQSQSQQSQPQQSQPQQSQPQQSQQSQPQQSQQSQPQQSQSQQSQPQQSQQSQSQQSQSVEIQRSLVPSMLEDAGRVLRQVQRQKKVLEENLEALLRARTGEVLYCQLEALAANSDWTEEVRIKQTVDTWINTLTRDIQRAAGSSTPAGRGKPVSVLRGTQSKPATGRGQTAGNRQLQGLEPDIATHTGGESYLSRLYGRAPYEGLRRTLKKSPYLRFSSPASLLSRKPRPRLVESVRGVKVKSCKTQTSLAPPLSRSPERPQRHDIISPSPADLTVTPAERYSVATAIPLGCPRMDSSRCVPERQQEVTSPPTAPPTSSVVAMDHELQSPVRSEVRGQRSLTGEFVSKVEQLGSGEAKPPPTDEIIEMKNGEEENIFPGTEFLSVADVQQVEQSIVDEEAGLVGEEVVQLDGGPSPPPVLYQGPVFPPQARSALPAQDEASVLGLDLQRNALETRLVEWVEQQLISRMISEIHHPLPCDPAQNYSTDQSELSKQSVTSDILEAAGGAGLQLFADCSLSVDSALIRQLVDEVLTEHIALMLGHRDTLETGPEPQPPKPGPRAHEEERPVLLLPTPEPTPPPSPTPPSRETPPLTTPPPSEPTSLLNEEFPQPITAPEPIATPTPSPEPAPSAGSPAVHQAPPPLTWGDSELPLDKERPEEHLDTHTQPLVMSAQLGPPLSPTPPPPLPPSCPTSPPPTSSSSYSSSSSSSSVTIETEAALRHISEGELLISISHQAAMTEEAVCSFSSSLQEFQDMDLDQVRSQDVLLMDGERPQPEGSWGRDQEEEMSVGEVRDICTTKPHRTTNPKSSTQSAAGSKTSSPGQISADLSEATNQDLVNVGDLMVEPVSTLTSDFQTELLLTPLPHLEDAPTAGQVVPVVNQLDSPAGVSRRAGLHSRRVELHLPSSRLDESVANSTNL